MKPFKEVIDGIRKAVMASEVREDIAQMGEYVEQFANTAGENIQKAIDPTLSVSGKAADAAKVGTSLAEETTRAKAAEETNAQGIGQLKEDLGATEKYIDTRNTKKYQEVTYTQGTVESTSNETRVTSVEFVSDLVKKVYVKDGSNLKIAILLCDKETKRYDFTYHTSNNTYYFKQIELLDLLIKYDIKLTIAKDDDTAISVSDVKNKVFLEYKTIEEELITKDVYKNTNDLSLWEVGAIGGDNVNSDNPKRLRTKNYIDKNVKYIDVLDGYEFALVCANEKGETKDTIYGFFDTHVSEFQHIAVYNRSKVNISDMSFDQYTNIRLILRKIDTNEDIEVSEYKNVILYSKESGPDTVPLYYNEKNGGGQIQNAHNSQNNIWSMWNGRLAFGMDTSKANVPFRIDGQLYANGTIIAHNTGSQENNRWGFHVFEAYSKDNYSRATMLLNKHDNEVSEKPSLEFYYYIGENHYASSYGNTKIGSDVLYHSFFFSRDVMIAGGEIDCRYPITLARISPSKDIDRTYETVDKADEAYEPENNAVENIRCLKYIALKNAANGAMFYDTDRNKVVCKINGKWCDLQFTDASSNYNF